MSPLDLLAQTSPAPTPRTMENILLLIVGVLGGTGILATVMLMTAKGYWNGTIAPLIETEILKWHTSTTQTDARTRERLASFKEWYEKREQHEEREKELQNLLRTPTVVDENTKVVKLIIDNEIKRSDGLISKEIKTQVSDMESRLLSKLEEMSQGLRENTATQQQMLQKMGHLQGAINAMMPTKAGISPMSVPPIALPAPDRHNPR